jgi:hypothetical protein
MLPAPRAFTETPFSRPAGAPAVDLRPPRRRLPWCPFHDGGLQRRCTCDVVSPPERGPRPTAPLDPLLALVADRAIDGSPIHASAGQEVERVYREPRWRIARGEWARAFRDVQAIAAAERRRARCAVRSDEGRDNRGRLYPAQDNPRRSEDG